MLGGGHGFLQGRYGLMADNLVSARLVTADGTMITASDTENKELFWALRGAGHNFGILTSFEYRIYDRTAENENWSYEFFTYTRDKFDEIYQHANSITGLETPAELLHFSMWMRNPEIDDKNVRAEGCSGGTVTNANL